ncbi:hypothetical protein AgCh_020264 [Apium graveolens]
MNPKIADFGVARLFNLDETQGITNRIVGTHGYMAPEYAMYGQFSVKSDVFSFGVLILEILSGQKNHCFRNGDNAEDLASFAWKNWREGATSNVIDHILKNSSGSVHEMIRCVHIGLLCVQENIIASPAMASVVLMLNSFSLTLPVPSEPAFFMQSTIGAEMPLLSKVNGKSKDCSVDKVILHSCSKKLTSVQSIVALNKINWLEEHEGEVEAQLQLAGYWRGRKMLVLVPPMPWLVENAIVVSLSRSKSHATDSSNYSYIELACCVCC